MKRVLVTFAILCSIFVADSVRPGGAEPAGAYCSQWGSAATITPYWGQERVQYSSTCDGDDIYKGKVRDVYTDGKCVTVQVGASSLGPWITMTSACSWSYVNFTAWTTGYEDIRICRGSLGCTGSYWNKTA